VLFEQSAEAEDFLEVCEGPLVGVICFCEAPLLFSCGTETL